MRMVIHLKYGKNSMGFDFPEGTGVPDISEPSFSIDKETFRNDLLKNLPDDRERYFRVSIVVSDKTRLCGYPQYLPWITETLKEKGATEDHITFYIAYGTHPPQSDEESLKSYGKTFEQFKFVHHDCRNASLFEIPVTTRRGTPVTIRKDILESTLLITFGSISHHYFAGFGGGRKLIFPGLASREAIYHNHSLFLDFEKRTLAEGCQPGKLLNNPLADDLKEIDNYMPKKISVHGIMDSAGQVCRLMVGSTWYDFEEACQEHDRYFRYPSSEKYDMVVASSGGYPKDINFIQAHKSVHHAASFVKDGGTLIILSECIDGIASDYFLKYLEAGSFEAAFSMLERNYEGNGGTALSMMLKTRRIRIHMLTSLNESICKTLDVVKTNVPDIQETINSHNGSIAVIRNASMLIR